MPPGRKDLHCSASDTRKRQHDNFQGLYLQERVY